MRTIALSMALTGVLLASAQMEVGLIEGYDYPYYYEPLSEGTVVAKTDNVTMMWGNDDGVRQFSTSFNGVRSIKVNGIPVDIGEGIFGETNPSGDDVYEGPKRGGAQYHFEVSADGWMVVFTRIRTNKPYFVYEGDWTGTMRLMAYTFGAPAYDLDVCPDGHITYSLPSDSKGYCVLDSARMDRFLLGTHRLQWPARIYTQDPETGVGGEVSTYGTGVIVFPVTKAGKDYWVYCTGSKMMTCGYAFVPGRDVPTVTIPEGNARTGEDLTVIPDGFGNDGPEEPLEQLAAPTWSYDGRYVSFYSDDPEAEIHYNFSFRGHAVCGEDWEKVPYEGIVKTGELLNMGCAGIFQLTAKREGFKDSETVEAKLSYYGNGEFAYTWEPGRLSDCYGWSQGKLVPDGRFNLSGNFDERDFAWITRQDKVRDLRVEIYELHTADGMLPANAFALPNLRSIYFGLHQYQSAVPLFGNTKKLCYVKVDHYYMENPVFDAGILEGVDNRNLIIELDGDYMPYDKSLKEKFPNVVDLSEATHDIVITDGYPFWVGHNGSIEHCNVEYTRRFDKTTGLDGETAGWETISLPFVVQKIWNVDKQCYLRPFGFNGEREEGSKNFWLYLNGSSWIREGYMSNATQYLISMPNNPEYGGGYNVDGEVKFMANDVYVCRIPSNSYLGNVEFLNLVPNFEWVEKSDSVMTVNDDWYEEGGKSYPPGSVFVANQRDVRPFEAYVKATPGTPARKIMQESSAIEGILADIDGMKVIVTGGRGSITFRASFDTDMTVYDIHGRRVAEVRVTADEPVTLSGLAPGIYVTGRRKILVK